MPPTFMYAAKLPSKARDKYVLFFGSEGSELENIFQ